MIRFAFRLLALAALSVAAIMAVRDITRSIAISKFDPTPLGGTWYEYAPRSLETMEQYLTSSGLGALWDPAMLAILKVPGFVAFAVLALLLYAIGHRRERHIDRFAA